jgi:predicted nucleic acid-binding protein
MSAVANSSPLIHLATLGDLPLLKILFREITIPEGVYQEVVTEGRALAGAREVEEARGTWITVAQVRNQARVDSLIRDQGLHRGESEAIVLAEELRAKVLLTDDRRAVAFARQGGFSVIRTPALYARGKTLGLVPTVREKLDALRREGFCLKDSDYEQILRAVDEV